MNKNEIFRYDVVSGRYYAKDQSPPTFVFDKEEGSEIKPMTIDQAFGIDSNDLPF